MNQQIINLNKQIEIIKKEPKGNYDVKNIGTEIKNYYSDSRADLRWQEEELMNLRVLNRNYTM